MLWTARNAQAACSGTAYREAHPAWPIGKSVPAIFKITYHFHLLQRSVKNPQNPP